MRLLKTSSLWDLMMKIDRLDNFVKKSAVCTKPIALVSQCSLATNFGIN